MAMKSYRRAALKALPMAFAFIQAIAVSSDGLAADFGVQTRRAHHARAWLVRDYDGMPILLRGARATIVHGYDGTIIARGRLDAYWVQRAEPPRYLNGQRVRTPYIERLASY